MKRERVAFSLLLALLACTVPAAASVPTAMNYQGRLTQPSGAPIADGTYSILFSIYDQPTGGNLLWSETNSSVAVKGGLFSVLLGSVTPVPATIFDNQTRYFAAKVGSDAELTPRQRIASSAFAFRTDVAATVDDGSITAAKMTADVATPVSSISMCGGSSAPTGWLLCDGSAVSRTTYSALFSALGTAYGAGDGSTTFNLPDMRQRFPLGKAVSGTGATLGEVGGAIDHKHRGWGANGGDLRATIGAPNGNAAALGFIALSAIDPDTGVGLGAPTYVVQGASNGAGGYFSHYTEVVGHTGTANPPYTVVNYIIKY